MCAMRPGPPRDVKQAILEAWFTNDQINQLLLKKLDRRAWRREPPGGKGRTIAAIVSHMHNDRLMWLKMTGRRAGLPAQTSRFTVTPTEASAALKKSARAFARLLAEGLARDDLRVKNFPPDVVALFSVMMIHEGHHRGQICMLARHMGYSLHRGYEIWQWNKCRKEALKIRD